MRSTGAHSPAAFRRVFRAPTARIADMAPLVARPRRGTLAASASLGPRPSSTVASAGVSPNPSPLRSGTKSTPLCGGAVIRGRIGKLRAHRESLGSERPNLRPQRIACAGRFGVSATPICHRNSERVIGRFERSSWAGGEPGPIGLGGVPLRG